jgi:hypothetical protein
VFGEVTLNGKQEDVFASTILVEKLHEMELWIRDLKPPRWEEIGRVNTELAETGESSSGSIAQVVTTRPHTD